MIPANHQAYIFLSMPENRYWSLGDDIGRAWNKANLAVGMNRHRRDATSCVST